MFLLEILVQVAVGAELVYQINVLFVIELAVQCRNVRMVQVVVDLQLTDHCMQNMLLHYDTLRYLFD